MKVSRLLVVVACLVCAFSTISGGAFVANAQPGYCPAPDGTVVVCGQPPVPGGQTPVDPKPGFCAGASGNVYSCENPPPPEYKPCFGGPELCPDGNIAAARSAQNKEFDRAVKECERQIGREITLRERRELHDAITKQGAGYEEIVWECVTRFEKKPPRY